MKTYKRVPSAQGWASKISELLKQVLGPERFPVDVVALAQDYSRQVYTNEPIIAVKGDDLPGFEGALYRLKKGWAIFYNNSVKSKGRINFTLAHEFGHYLIHRLDNPEGMECKPQDFVRWDSAYAQIEHQANTFAANLLMPFDDFRLQIPATSKVTLDMLSHCADRYDVSLIAATLQWLRYTTKRAVLVVSRDGYILWSRSSEPAFKSGVYFKTSENLIEIPSTALPNRMDLLVDGRATIQHPVNVWLTEEVQEIVLMADHYDFAISLLLLEDASGVELPEDDYI